MKRDISVVMLTHNEEIHIERCIKSLLPVAHKIFIVDSFSNDRTVEIAESLGAVVAQRKWKNYADQFQWGLDNCAEYCGGKSEWVMRWDADEYFEPELIDEINQRLPQLEEDVTGVYLRRQVKFMGRMIKHGDFAPHILLRIWRAGKGRIEQRWMDEHIVLPPDSKTVMFENDMVDDNLKGITFWVNKHNSYASREAVDILNGKYQLLPSDDAIKQNEDPQAKRKRLLKEKAYAKMAPGVRALFYYLYRYILRLGFLDGWQGFIFHTMQGLWYRMLVDVKIMEIEAQADGDPEKVRQIFKDEYGIKL